MSDSFFEILERAYKNKKRGDLLTTMAVGWGPACYCASVHSQAVKWSKTQGKTSVDILFTSRHQVSLMMELIASPCSRIRVESRC